MTTLAANAIERLFFRLDAIGAPSQIFWAFSLDGRPAREPLERALAATIDAVPRLASTVHRRPWGFERRPVTVDVQACLEISPAATAREAFEQAHPDLARRPPVRVFVQPRGEGGADLVLALHHSVADAYGALIVARHLAQAYAAIATDAPLPPPPPLRPPGTRRYLSELDAEERRAALRESTHMLSMLKSIKRPQQPFATFVDQPLPTTGRLRYRVLALSFDRVSRLMRWSARRQGSPLDALMAATVVAASKTWPQPEARPVVLSLPVSLRGEHEQDICNRAGIMDMAVPAADALDLAAAFEHIRRQTAAARRRTPAILQLVRRMPISALPPSLFERLAGDYFDKPDNTRESIAVTALPLMEQPLTRFGTHAVEDCALYGSLLAPPGLRLSVVKSGGRLALSFAYLEPATAPATIDRLLTTLDAELAILERQRR